MAKNQNESCYICGKPATTRDHVPPQAIFSNPKPTNLITVPACKKCNHGSSLDDEYFRWFITTSSSDMPQAQKLVYERIFKSHRKRPALLQSLMKSATKIDLFSRGGIFLKQVPALKYDKTRILNILRKIVKGLYWHEKEIPFDDKLNDIKFFFYPPPPNKQMPPPPDYLQAAIRSSPLNEIGDGKTFAYRCCTGSTDEQFTVFLLVFFETTAFLVIILPIEQL